MSPEQDAIAREAVTYAHAFGDHLTAARCKSGTAEQRQTAAAKAMLSLHLMERQTAELKRLMPRSREDGVGMAKDLKEVSR